jgi:hypothetical protein
VADAELAGLASLLEMTEAELRGAYVRTAAEGGRVLRQRANGDCVFWGTEGCSVYPARPRQCRTYPFWRANLHSPESWRAEVRECPGIGATGAAEERPLHSTSEIEAAASDDGIPAHRTRLRTGD